MYRPIIAALIFLGLSITGNPFPVFAQSLVETVKTGNLRSVKKILSKKSTNVNEVDSDGLTSLMVATIANDSLMVETLIAAGVDPNIQSKSGMTALHAAAFNNRDQIMPMIIAMGADPNKIDSKGRTPLLVAAQMGHTNPITYLIQAGADLEFKDIKGNTALMLACGGRHLGAVDELLDKGANPNSRDLQGRTPLMLLSLLGEDEMVRILLKFKADVTLVDHSMKTALAYAREYHRRAVIALLEKSGAKY